METRIGTQILNKPFGYVEKIKKTLKHISNVRWTDTCEIHMWIVTGENFQM